MTGLPFSNASLLDEATSAAEAMYLAHGQFNGKRKDFFVSNGVFPFIKDTIKTKAYYLGINIIEGDYNDPKILENTNLFGGIVQNPDNHGKVTDYSEFTEKMKANKAISIVAADIMSLLISKTPGEMGFDIAVGSSQRFGVPMMNGGPHAGFFAVHDSFKRKVPGRVVGVSKDKHGNKALRLAMQTREQHIRRDKATSNICTAQALLANMAAFYSIFHGKKGLVEISTRINILSSILHSELKNAGYAVLFAKEDIFDTVTINLEKSNIVLKNIIQVLEEHKINIRQIDDSFVSVTINETTNLSDLEELLSILLPLKNNKNNTKFNIIESQKNFKDIVLNQNLRRQDNEFLHQDIFNKYSSETQLLRYIYYLQSKDISLANSMISLGSCTMKMNATSELVNNNK